MTTESLNEQLTLTDEEPSESAESHVPALSAAMQQYWGYDSFRPLQRQSMLSAMSSVDSLTVLPTGGGKSLCYQVPAVCRKGMAIVVSPLIALMKDQVDALTECGIPAAYVNSTLSMRERMEVADRIRSGELQMLFAAPERLVQDRTISFLKDRDVSFIAIDEAHCISNWGHDFRPEYRQLASLREAFPDISIHAFTATATERVRQDIIEQLQLRAPEVLVGDFDRQNLTYRVERRYDPLGQIRRVLDRHRNESGIVYCISRSNVDDTTQLLRKHGYRALPYHAGMEKEERQANQEAFLEDRADIIVATVAFGMGIDKSNVRFVVHAEMPSSVEAYQQESGRAGRDGLEAECTLLYSGRDVSTWEFLINQSDSEDNRRSSLQALGKIESFCSSVTCRHRLLVEHFGQTLESENCGACDVCLKETDPVTDPLTVAQKILSSVYRQGQQYGAEYTTLVLRGSRSKKVVRNGHEKLSTYGLLKDEADFVVRGWIDQLITQGFLKRIGEHMVLEITATGGELLRGSGAPVLTRPRGSTQSQSSGEKWEGVDTGLFEELRQLRMEIAAERGVPPYVIFGDVTLRDLARYRPTSQGRLLSIYGIGQQKCDQFGERFVAAILGYAADHGIKTDISAANSASVMRSRRRTSDATSERYFEMFDQGLTIDEAALQLDRAHSTVSGYLVKYIAARRVSDASQFISTDTVQRVEAAIAAVGDQKLKAVFEHLEGAVTWDDIRIICACSRNAAST